MCECTYVCMYVCIYILQHTLYKNKERTYVDILYVYMYVYVDSDTPHTIVHAEKPKNVHMCVCMHVYVCM